MAGLVHTLAQVPGGGVRLDFGTAYWDGAEWSVRTTAGNLLKARWFDPIQPMQGGPLVYALTKDDYGLSSAFVVGGYTDRPRPSTGSVLAVGVSEIAFTGEDGGSYTTDRFVNPYVPGPLPEDPPRLTYAPGDPVYLTWDAGRTTILGIIPSVTVTPPPTQPVGGPAVMPGTTTLVATASDTFGVGGWGRWATSQAGGEDVYSGTWTGQTVTGSWFYGAPRAELAGKTISRVRFYLPARLPGVGASGDVAVHIYAHTSGARPAADVTRVAGPHDITIPAGFGGVFVDLDPAVFGPHLVAGGGIGIAGDPYVGFISRLDNPEAGKVLIDWSA